jgi:hypothetical protein
MGGGVSRRTLEDVTGDFLPRRRQASILSQALTVVIVLAVVGLAAYLFG